MTRVHDVLVVGGGHAGCEAALAAARLGASVLLVTGSIDRIAAMSCNPAIGGVGKGHLVKELDVLGGEMARVADATGIHFRTLNESRGPAVRATRCQSDMERYRQTMGGVVVNTPNLRVRQDDVVALEVETHAGSVAVVAVRTRHGEVLRARRVVLTTGTFLGGLLHRGDERLPGGRAGEAPAAGLSASLAALGMALVRLKTGTCPRLDARSIHMDELTEQKPDVPAPRFSADSDLLHLSPPPLPQVSCRLTHTTKETHRVIAEAVARGESPLFNGAIAGKGPRYCPSLEDKVVKFPDKGSHLIFLEPHGLDTPELYPLGLSTSLAPAVQLAFLRTIPGLQDVEVTRYGYAVEYDAIDPTQLLPSLQSKGVAGLYCAGQLNGTTGYEEAAVQGLLAGVNATRSLQGLAPVVLGRDQAYAGVLVDDLTTRGTDEPYRMFTSRAEHRLILREDNVGARLGAVAEEIGLASASRRARYRAFEEAVGAALDVLRATRVRACTATAAVLAALGQAPLKETTTALSLLRRPDLDWPALRALLAADTGPAPTDTTATLDALPAAVQARVAVEVKYEGYLGRAEKERARERSLDDAALPARFWERLSDGALGGISHEVREKLLRLRPQTLGQAGRIPGVTPAAVGIVAVELVRLRQADAAVEAQARAS